MRLCIIIGLLLYVLAPLAWADDPALASPRGPESLLHYKRGNRLYRVRKFDEAIASYQAGAMIEPVAVFDFNLGQSYRQIGKYKEAVWHYERFLRHGQPEGELHALVTRFIAQLKGGFERTAMTQPPAEPAPPAKPLATSEPRWYVDSIRGGDLHGMPSRRRLAITVGTAGVAVVGLGLGLGLRAQSFEDDAAELCSMPSCEHADEANGLIDRGRANAFYANVALGIGGAAILGSVVLWLTGTPRERERTAIVPRISRISAGLEASLRF